VLVDIYARSFTIATRQDCVHLRELPPVEPAATSRKGIWKPLAALSVWLKGTGRQTRCVKPQEI